MNCSLRQATGNKQQEAKICSNEYGSRNRADEPCFAKGGSNFSNTLMEYTMKSLYRIGQIVPSSNFTMETEIPAMLQARQLIRP
jgi:hypothetical protein